MVDRERPGPSTLLAGSTWSDTGSNRDLACQRLIRRTPGPSPCLAHLVPVVAYLAIYDPSNLPAGNRSAFDQDWTAACTSIPSPKSRWEIPIDEPGCGGWFRGDWLERLRITASCSAVRLVGRYIDTWTRLVYVASAYVSRSELSSEGFHLGIYVFVDRMVCHNDSDRCRKRSMHPAGHVVPCYGERFPLHDGCAN